MLIRRYIFLFLLALPAGDLHAQLLWERNWGGPWDDGCEVRNTRDGGLIVVASIGITDSYMVKTDANGDTIWTRTVTLPIDLCGVTETEDGGYLATGVTRTPNRDVLAFRFDSRGDSVWMKTYRDSTSFQGSYTVLPLDGGAFLLTGYTSANGFDMLAMKIDSSGNLLWRKTYGTPGFEAGAMPAKTADGGFVFTTTAGPANYTYFWLVRTDSLGDTLWTRSYPTSFPTGGSVATVTSGGDILLIGWISDANYDNYLVCTDSQGIVKWTNSYGGYGFESRTARGIIEDISGGFTFVSSVEHSFGPGQDRDIAIYQLDTLGAVQRIHRVGHGGDDMPRYFEQCPNGDYVVLGYTTSFFGPSVQQVYLARLNPTQCGEYFYTLNSPNYDTVCPGDTLWIDGGSGFLSYVWSDGLPGQVRPALRSDTLYVTAIDSAGCVNYSNGIVILAHPTPAFTWLQTSGLTISFNGDSGLSTQYLWTFGDGSSDQQQNPQHVFPSAGTYNVCFSQLLPGCGWSGACDSVSVSGSLGSSQPANSGFGISPNPASDFFQVTWPSDAELVFKLASLDGRVLFIKKQEQLSSVSPVDVRHIQPGFYLAELWKGEELSAVKKIIVAR